MLYQLLPRKTLCTRSMDVWIAGHVRSLEGIDHLNQTTRERAARAVELETPIQARLGV